MVESTLYMSWNIYWNILNILFQNLISMEHFWNLSIKIRPNFKTNISETTVIYQLTLKFVLSLFYDA